MGIGPVLLAPRGLLSPTSPVDTVVSYYRFGTGWLWRRRLKWARDALPGDSFARVLEVGYGSGIFMHELAKHASQLYGSDVHRHGADVRARLARDGVVPYLVTSESDALPFRDGSFDAVVIVSALQVVTDPASALREAVRVVRPGGGVICVAPRVLPWAARLSTMLPGLVPVSGDQGAGKRVQTALADRSLRAERSTRPRLAPRFLAPYELVVLRRLPERARADWQPRLEPSTAAAQAAP